MDVAYDAFPEAQDRIVYVRPVAVSGLPQELQLKLAGATTVYSVNSEDGEPLALVADRAMAFSLARQHDFAPVNAH
jgi:hypothetical protein